MNKKVKGLLRLQDEISQRFVGFDKLIKSKIETFIGESISCKSVTYDLLSANIENTIQDIMDAFKGSILDLLIVDKTRKFGLSEKETWALRKKIIDQINYIVRYVFDSIDHQIYVLSKIPYIGEHFMEAGVDSFLDSLKESERLYSIMDSFKSNINSVLK